MRKNIKEALCMWGMLIAMLLAGTGLVLALGGHHHQFSDFKPWDMQVGVYGCVAGTVSYCIAAFGFLRMAVMRFRSYAKDRKIENLGYVAIGVLVGIAAFIGVLSELSRTARCGFSPDPMRRTVTMTILLLGSIGYIGNLIFPHDPEEQNNRTEGDAVPAEGDDIRPATKGSLAVAWIAGIASFAVLVYLVYGQVKGMIQNQCESPAPAEVEQPAAQRAQVAPPANLEDLSRAFVCVGCGDKDLLGSGVLLGHMENGRRTVMLVSAAHVAQGCRPRAGEEPDVLLMLHNCVDADDVFYRIKDGANRWIAHRSGTDLAVIDLTEEFDQIVAACPDVRYIRISPGPTRSDDEFSIAGVAVLPRSMMMKYGIGIGTEVRIFGLGAELWMVSRERKQQPLALRKGAICSRLDFFDDENPDWPLAGPILIESGVRPGFSGGPVFAYVMFDGRAYPILVGIVRSILHAQEIGQVIQGIPVGTKSMSGYAQVTPLDVLVQPKDAKPVEPLRRISFDPAPVSDDRNTPTGKVESVRIEIRKGETVIDPPFIDPLKYKAMTYTNEFRGFTPLAGDYVKWNGGGREIKWTFDGKSWRFGNQAHPVAGIPLGSRAFVYGREQDVVSTMTIFGFIDPDKVKARVGGQNPK